MVERFHPLDPLGIFGRVKKDVDRIAGSVPPSPPGLTTKPRNPIPPGPPGTGWMTERELVIALLQGRVKREELVPSPRTESVLKEYEEMKAELENPRLYWEKVIENTRQRLIEAEEAMKRGDRPRWAEGIAV